MKIKLLKDIPGYVAGTIVHGINGKSCLIYSPAYAVDNSGDKFNLIKYPFETLLSEGFAEEVKDEIDIEEIGV